MIETTNISEDQLLLLTGDVITFSDEQYDGLKKIRNWLKNGKTNIFTLAGYAGTGKSTIIKKILDDYRGGVVVSAPTHKAKKVIINTTNKEGLTLSSLLGLRPDVDLDSFNPNDPRFNPIAMAKICNYNFVIIDEASMINNELYELILEKVNNSRTKVLFMGDPAQIPPIKEKRSVVFFQEKDDKEFHQLLKTMRQKDTNPIMIIYDTLRNNLETLNGNFKRKTLLNDYNEGIIFEVNKRKFRDLVLNDFSTTEFKKDTDYCKLIAWKNDTVMKSNEVIRKELLNKTSDIVEINDLIMGYRTVTSGNMRINVIENSADYRIVEKSKLEKNEYDIYGFSVKLQESLSRGKFSYRDVFVIDVNNYDSLHTYAEMHDFLKDLAKSNKKKWKQYYEFRRNNLLMKTIDKYRNGLYRNYSEIIVKDIDYGYAITGHKSQGSTYTNVFVLENDIYQNWVMRERNQILYVALTRPTNKATVLTTKIDEDYL